MSDSAQPIRSYQRIFRPDRRIYQIDGRRIPVPGGVPLEWLAWAFSALVLVLVLSERSIVFALVLGGMAAVLGGSLSGLRGVLLAGLCGVLATLVAGTVLDWVAWPLRLLIAPAMIATVACQAAPDGRPAHRYLRSWVALALRPGRYSLERPIPADGLVQLWAPGVWVAPDEHSPVLHHGRVRGPARLVFGRAVVAIPARGRVVVRPAEGHRMRAGERVCHVVELADGQVAEVRR